MRKRNVITVFPVDWKSVFVELWRVVPGTVLLAGSVVMATNSVSGWGWVLVSGIMLSVFRGKVK